MPLQQKLNLKLVRKIALRKKIEKLSQYGDKVLTKFMDREIDNAELAFLCMIGKSIDIRSKYC